MSEERTTNRAEILSLTAEIVSAQVSNTPISRDDLPGLIQSVFDMLSGLGGDDPTPVELTPAVPVKKSVTDDYIVCLEDGKKLKMLSSQPAQAPLAPEPTR